MALYGEIQASSSIGAKKIILELIQINAYLSLVIFGICIFE